MKEKIIQNKTETPPHEKYEFLRGLKVVSWIDDLGTEMTYLCKYCLAKTDCEDCCDIQDYAGQCYCDAYNCYSVADFSVDLITPDLSGIELLRRVEPDIKNYETRGF